MRALWFIALAACVPPRSPPQACTADEEVAAPTPAPLRADGRFFKDRDDRVVLLRGVNLAGDSKLPPFATVTDEAALDPLPGWGVNVLRLLFTWEAFEPEPCAYDETYLAYYERVTEWAAARGLYVIVDFHQDAFSRFSIDGCGEGFPEWAVLSSIALSRPDNGKACAGWGVKMVFDSAHLDTWTAFHRDLEGARTRYLAMVGRVAARMSRHANVIGYDVINEPWGQSYELQALFEDAGREIRARDPERILFIPPQALGSSGVANAVPKVSHGNIAHSPHYYDASIVIAGAWNGSPVDGPLDGMKRTADDWAAPMLLGEFGAAAHTKNAAKYVEAFYTWLDARFVSATQWNYTPGWTPERKDGWNDEDFSITADGALRSQLFVPRPYPQKTAGEPLSFVRDATGATYRWRGVAGSTELFVLDGQAATGADCVRIGSTLACACEGECEVRIE